MEICATRGVSWTTEIPKTRAAARNTGAAEEDLLWTAGTAITDAQRGCTRPQCRGPEGDVDAATCSRCQRTSAVVGLSKVSSVSPRDPNASNAQVAGTDVCQRDSLRRTSCVKHHHTEVQAGRREFCGRADSTQADVLRTVNGIVIDTQYRATRSRTA